MRTTTFGTLCLLCLLCGSATAQDERERALKRYGTDYRKMGIIQLDIVLMETSMKREVANLEAVMPGPISGDFVTKMQLCRQMVRYSDDAAREARLLEKDFQRAYLLAPQRDRDLYKGEFVEKLNELKSWRRATRFYLYCRMTGHHWPWEREGKWEPTLNRLIYRIVIAWCDAEKEQEKFLKGTVAAWEIFFTDLWEDLKEVAQKMDVKKK